MGRARQDDAVVVGQDRFSEAARRSLGIEGHTKKDPQTAPPQQADFRNPRRSNTKLAQGIPNDLQESPLNRDTARRSDGARRGIALTR